MSLLEKSNPARPWPAARPVRLATYRHRRAARRGVGVGVASNSLHPVRRRLRELGKTQKSLARDIGCSSATLNNFMVGRSRLKEITYRRLLTALAIDENYLYR